MDPQKIWIIWAAAAALLMIAETFTMGFFIFWFGLGAVPSTLIAVFLPQMIWLQIVVYIMTTTALVLGTRKFAKRIYKSGPDIKVGSERILDRIGIVMENIDPMAGKGLVRVDHEQWLAESEDGSIIEKDLKVKVLRIDGTRLIVKKLN